MVTKIAERQVFRGRVTRVNEIDLDFGNGKQATFELISFDTVTGVSALPITTKGVMLIKHYQAGIDQESYSLPTGGLNAGENPVDRVQLELQEELGYKAGKLTLMLRAHPLPGYIGSEPGYIYLAEDLIPSLLPGDEQYDIKVMKFTWVEINDLLKRNEIIDLRTMTALLFYQRFFT